MVTKLSNFKRVFCTEKLHKRENKIIFNPEHEIRYSQKFIDCTNLDYELIKTKYHLQTKVYFRLVKDGSLREVVLKYGLFIDLNYLMNLSAACNFVYRDGVTKQHGYDLALYSIDIISPKSGRAIRDLEDDVLHSKNITVHSMLNCFPVLRCTQNYPELASEIKKSFAFSELNYTYQN